MVYEQGKDTEPLFRIERYEAGYFAVRDADPKFALAASTAGEAAEMAIRALEWSERIKAA